jgi:hypothetical protein
LSWSRPQQASHIIGSSDLPLVWAHASREKITMTEKSENTPQVATVDSIPFVGASLPASTFPLQEPFYRIAPPQGFLDLNLREVWNYKGLLYFLVWRDIKTRYKQTAIARRVVIDCCGLWRQEPGRPEIEYIAWAERS